MTASDPYWLDPQRTRSAFDRAAATYDAKAVLQREVGQRMAERLAVVKLKPAAILDAGCGTGDALSELAMRYPAALVLGLDVAYGMLAMARRRGAAARASRSLFRRWFGARLPAGERPRLICADACRLPLAPGSVDLVWSNLTLQWINDAAVAFAEFHRVLRSDGLLLFSTLGPDTLKELRRAFAAVDRASHVSRFIDMHDLGDMLLHAGFADPVMDTETITLTYADATLMMRELKAIGAHNATRDRPRGLISRARWQRVMTALEVFRRDGLLPATYEVVYGHAWKPAPRFAPDGSAVVRFEPHGRR